MRSLGAHHVIDYTREEFTRGTRRYDLILDLVGNHPPSACRRTLAAEGVYVASFDRPERRWLGPLGQIARMKLLSLVVSQTLTMFTAEPTRDDLLHIKERVEAGVLTPTIDRTYGLSQAPEAMRYLAQKRTRGKIVLTV